MPKRINNLQMLEKTQRYPNQEGKIEIRNYSCYQSHLSVFLYLNCIQTQHILSHYVFIQTLRKGKLTICRDHLITVKFNLLTLENSYIFCQLLADYGFIHLKNDRILFASVTQCALKWLWKLKVFIIFSYLPSIFGKIINIFKVIVWKFWGYSI